eukprot:PhM_4_TR10024/c4_g1_i10/m.94907/K08857/NEK1_4_5; NIMA (never in mitosis gene a)-related kinase 1/4/5
MTHRYESQRPTPIIALSQAEPQTLQKQQQHKTIFTPVASSDNNNNNKALRPSSASCTPLRVRASHSHTTNSDLMSPNSFVMKTPHQHNHGSRFIETALENPALAHRSLALRKQLLGTKDKEVWIVSEGNQQYVAKVLNMELMSQNERRFAMNEVKCLSNCDHPNIIRYVADYEHEGTILLLMELAPAGDLSLQVHARARNRAFFKRNEALVVFAQLCLAMDYIHNKSMMHRDIKSENIFITTAGVLKLGDFGFTRQYDVTISGTPGGTFCGTPHYLSPEICTHQPYGKKSDLFSVGVVLYELLALERPFKGQNITEIMNNVVTGKFRPVLDINPEAGDDIAKLCHAMLALDPERRPSLQHIFATSLMRVALSDLRVAVAAMTKIPDTDRRAMREHIERVIGGSACVRVRWSNSHGVAPSHVPVDVDLELVVSTCGTGVELRPWVAGVFCRLCGTLFDRLLHRVAAAKFRVLESRRVGVAECDLGEVSVVEVVVAQQRDPGVVDGISVPLRHSLYFLCDRAHVLFATI